MHLLERLNPIKMINLFDITFKDYSMGILHSEIMRMNKKKHKFHSN